jgi:hypothetical protein
MSNRTLSARRVASMVSMVAPEFSGEWADVVAHEHSRHACAPVIHERRRDRHPAEVNWSTYSPLSVRLRMRPGGPNPAASD